MSNRFFNRNLAGGALLDIGVYALSFVRWFMTSQPTEMVSQVKLAPTGVDEQAGILLTNREGEMATVTLSLHAKQPKRGTIAYDKGYIELYEYPRGQKAVITYTEDGSQEVIEAGETAKALQYEVLDMEAAVAGEDDHTLPQLQSRCHGPHDSTPQRLGLGLPRRRITGRKRGWDKSPSLSIVFGLSSKTQWLSGLYYADFISFYSPTQLCGGGTTKSNSNELPISVPLSFLLQGRLVESRKLLVSSIKRKKM